MSSAVSFGTNVEAQRKRVKYTESSTIYEGMPVCYDFDSTTNILGVDRSTGLASTTTTEGSQNEGKFLRVEDVDATNILWFAGVVAKGPKVGQTGPCWLEIFVPNGAIVPVRSDVSNTIGRTILALESASQALTQPLNATQGRPVAVAEETIDRSSTAGLTLARLCPAEFIYQDNTGDALIAAASGTSDVVVNRINVTSAQTGGRFCPLEIFSTVTGTPANTGYGFALYAQADINGIATGQNAGVSFWTNINAGGNIAGSYYGLEVGIYESGADLSGIADSDVIAPLCLRTQIDTTNPPGAGTHWMMYLRAETSEDAPDGLFACYTSRAINASAQTAAVVSHVIPIKMVSTQSGGLAAGTYYIMVSDTA